MSNTRPWILGAAALSVLLAVASWFLLISPERSKAADYKAQRVTQQQQNDQLRLDLAKLKAEKSDLPAKQAELAVIKRQLPNSPALPTLIRSLNSIAAESGAGLTSVAPSTPVSAATSAAAAGGAAAGVVPANLVAIPLTIVVDGTYAQSELFLQKLQTKVTRGLLVQNIQIAVQSSKSLSNDTPPTPVGNLLRTTIQGQVFVLLDTPTTTTTATGGSAATTTTPSTPTN
jgi:Tfp pilus assembly protein PilO